METRLWHERRNKKYMTDEEWEEGPGIVRVNDDLDDYFSVSLLHRVAQLFNQGYELEEISEIYNRNPEEMFLALYHLARYEKITRPFAYRKRKGRTNQ